jgi:16S rRNA (uracil1498-N3)-methyltransferase
MRTLFAPQLIESGTIVLDPEESHHGLKVLRLEIGDQVRLLDGLGAEAVGKVVSTDAKRLSIATQSTQHFSPSVGNNLRICVAAPQGSLYDDLVRSLTELGVGQIDLLTTERSRRVPSTQRAQRIAREACKQSRRPWLPRVGGLTSIPEILTETPSRLILLDPEGESVGPHSPVATTLLIGPEGGFTDEERGALTAQGAKRIRLAPHVLRIETAAIAAAAVFISCWDSSELDRSPEAL